MTENSMKLEATDPVAPETSADPGNSEPEAFTEDLTDDETLEANAAIEEAIKLLPVSNEGVL